MSQATGKFKGKFLNFNFRIYADGKKEVIFHNGVKRETYDDNYTIVHFTNDDIK
jgi:hypothetical protein